MTAGGDIQPPQERWRLVPVLVDTGVPAVIGAVVLAVFLFSIVVGIAVWARRVGCRSHISGGVPMM